MMLQHFLGLGDTNVYLSTLMKTKSYDKAQEAVNESILNRTGNLPKNLPVKDYINKFQNKLNELPKEQFGPTIQASKGSQPNNPLNNQSNSQNKIANPVLPEKLPTEKKELPKEEITIQEIKKDVNSWFGKNITDEQAKILLDKNKNTYQKFVELGLIKSEVLSSSNDGGILNNASQWFNRFMVKQGLADVNETEVVETKPVYKSDVKNSGVTYLGEVKGENSSYGTFYNKFDRNTGFAYQPVANVNKSNSKTEYNNVKGIAHFLLDSDATDDYKHEYSQTYMKKQLKNENIAPGSTVKDQFVPVREKLKDGKVNVKYKKVSELNKEDYIMAPLRQYSFTDINWDGSISAKGFANSIKALPTKTGEQTYFIYPNQKDGKNTYGKYGGGSVVFLANNKNFAIDFAGSINDIKNMALKIIEQEGIKPEDLIIGYHDLGSFSAKPKAGKDNKLYFNQWSGFNNSGHTGGALAFPSN